MTRCVRVIPFRPLTKPVNGQIFYCRGKGQKGKETGASNKYRKRTTRREMLKQRRREKQQRMELAIMEQMAPGDHFLRKVDSPMNFSFIHDLCAPLYCVDNGRPAIGPEILFRMLQIFVWDQIRGAAGRRDQPQYRVQVFLRAGFDGQGAGHDDDQPEPSPAFLEQQHRRAELRRDSAAILLRGQNLQEVSETNKTRWTGARRL